LPEVQDSAHLEAAFQLGDSESLQRLQERCEDARTHPAGWSALLDATLQPAMTAGQPAVAAGQPAMTGGHPAVAASAAREHEPPGRESSPQ
jgi:hypothetical protein